jgi:murein DD-endopeptidase MepM/ murein hydrolase activator NlpD
MRLLLLLMLAAVCAACQPDSANAPRRATLAPTQAAVAIATAVPTTRVPPSPTPTFTPTMTPTDTATATLTPTITLTPSATLTASKTPLPSATPTLAKIDFYAFQRPFPRTHTDYIDRTYPYGMGETRGLPIHHGVDIQNGRHTPILAIGAGTVYYAGTDLTRLFGPFADYYGNLVVIEHNVKSAEGLPVYSLYGHLQRISVETGDEVDAGEQIGTVGDAGVAFGPHLHLEIRVGDPEDFGASRNPELWIFPYPGFGTLAGRVTDADGSTPYELTVTVRRAGLSDTFARYAYTYSDDPLINSDAAWNENFTLGDLPEDEYDVIVSERSGRVRFRDTVTIENGRTTWVDIRLRP